MSEEEDGPIVIDETEAGISRNALSFLSHLDYFNNLLKGDTVL